MTTNTLPLQTKISLKPLVIKTWISNVRSDLEKS